MAKVRSKRMSILVRKELWKAEKESGDNSLMPVENLRKPILYIQTKASPKHIIIPKDSTAVNHFAISPILENFGGESFSSNSSGRRCHGMSFFDRTM
jgi:hypothetical protein